MRLADVYGGTGDGAAESAGDEPGGEGGGDSRGDEGAVGGGRWLCARRADSDAPRWQAVVAASSHGASGGEGTRRRPSAMGLRFMLRSGVPLDGLFGLACCPLCGQAGVPLDVRHVLSGECDGASAEERAHAAALLQGLEAKLPLGADAHEGAGRHDAALARELRLAARVLGAAGGAVPRGETSDGGVVDGGAAGQWHAAGARAWRARGDTLSEAEESAAILLLLHLLEMSIIIAGNTMASVNQCSLSYLLVLTYLMTRALISGNGVSC